MEDLPSALDRAKVLSGAPLADLSPSGRSMILVGGAPIPQPRALAVCQYDGENDVYLFYCSDAWSVLAAGHFPSMAAALSAAENAYPGVSAKWVSRG